MRKITFNRHELYKLVWSQPMTTFAKEYGVSASTIRKICREMDVPIPNMGHWQKIQYGKSPIVIELPLNYAGNQNYTLEIREMPNRDGASLSVQQKLQQEIENSPELTFSVPSKLKQPDILIIKAKEGYPSQRYIRSGGDCLRTTNDALLDITVAPKNINRALIFMDSVIKLLRTRGHDVIINSNGTCAIIFGEEITICLQEKLRIKESVDKYNWRSRQYFPSGILTFRMWKHFRFNQKIWSDGRQLIEYQLSKILAGLELLAKKEKEERIEREKRWKEQAEQERIEQEIRNRKEQEKVAFKNLIKQSKRWHKSQMIRAYINEVESNANRKGELSNELKAWLKWSKQKVDWFDPLH
jgi:hypothetical protein